MSNDISRVQRRKRNDANGLDHICAPLLKDSAILSHAYSLGQQIITFIEIFNGLEKGQSCNQIQVWKHAGQE
jgi:hypothetical protein